jgi:hypothetical protein
MAARGLWRENKGAIMLKSDWLKLFGIFGGAFAGVMLMTVLVGASAPGYSGPSSGVSLSGTNTWTGAQTVNADLVVSTGQRLLFGPDTVGTGVRLVRTGNQLLTVQQTDGSNPADLACNSLKACANEIFLNQAGSALEMDRAYALHFNPGSPVSNGPDTGIRSPSAGVIEFNNGSAGGKCVGQLNAYTFATLPTGVVGMYAYISDSTVNTWGTTIAGGGANKVLAWYNGTNWTVAGK